MRKRGRKNHIPHYPASPLENPTIAILGRPNVGKSTLFNRLAGRTASIVKDEPGVTRDRIYATAEVLNKLVTLVDTGGWEYSPENETEAGINRQCQRAMEEASLVLFVVDGRVAPTAGDIETARLLRKKQLPVILVVNKVDGPRQEADASEMYSLGMENVVMVSSVHGRNFDILEELMCGYIPESAIIQYKDDAETDEIQPNASETAYNLKQQQTADMAFDSDDEGDPDTEEADLDADETDDEPELDDAEDSPQYATRIAVIGRPNAGKSSLINKLLNEDRLLTMNEPGTTRDAIDTHIRLADGREYVFVDTAGMRRKSKIEKESSEHLAVSAAINVISKCRVVVLMIDASGDVAEQDARILGLAVDRWRSVVIALNKWDLLKGDAERQRVVKEKVQSKIAFAPWAKVVTISALNGKGIHQMLDAIDESSASFSKRVPTGKLNALFDEIITHHPPPVRKGRPVRLYFATQSSVRPPTFVVQCSYPEALHFSYQRYVENRIREVFGFDGTPIRMIFRKRARRGDKN